MATIHRTTMAPGKLDLLGDWLPQQLWYRDPGRRPTLSRAGGFRLDDPAGDVGIEFIFVTDRGEGTTYHVPLTYRGAPLLEAEDGLLGTSEHGVLGRRWIYDAAHDPVAVAQLLEFICGATVAQHQNESDTPDPSIGRHCASAGRLVAPSPLKVENTEPGRTTVGVDLIETSSGPSGHALDVVRVLPGSSAEEASLGYVEADWTRLDGSTARGRVVVVR
jgi:Maltokinase N-terminal cap domain